MDATGTSPLYLRSELEERALALIRAAALPEPLGNSLVAGLEVDFVWSAPRVVPEVDGLAFHRSDTSFHRDRARDRILAAAGYQVLRFTWHQLTTSPHACVAALSVALARKPA